MLDGFIARSVPINGVGFQMHIFMDYPSISTISEAFKKAVNRNLKVKITELDIPINNPYSSAYQSGDIKRELTMGLSLAQKKRYCEVVKAYMDTVPAHLRGGVTVWGVSDLSSWLISALFQNAHSDWPLLFDAAYAGKPALRGVADGLTGKPIPEQEPGSVWCCSSRAEVKPEDVDTILLTHIHPDHACGITPTQSTVNARLAELITCNADRAPSAR